MRKFRKTYIEITSTCNLACTFCPGTTRPPQFMEREFFGNVLEECKPYSQLIHLHVYGEPTLHPELGFFLDDCESYGLKVHLVTNGVMLDSVVDQLCEKPAVRSISISLQSMCSDSVMSHIDTYLLSLRSFVDKINRAGGPWITLRLWNFGDENPEISNDKIFEKIASVFGFDLSVFRGVDGKRGFLLKENLYINTAERFEWPDLSGPDYGELGHCLGLRDQIAVLVDGTVVPCCLDIQGVIALGNLHDTSLRTILESERVSAIRDGFSRGVVVESLCKRCTYRLRFSG